MGRHRSYEVYEIQEMFKDELKCCDCEMNFGGLCAGVFYGKTLSDEDMNKKMCEGYDISLDKYIELCDRANKEK